jgi:hypothetical protein
MWTVTNLTNAGQTAQICYVVPEFTQAGANLAGTQVCTGSLAPPAGTSVSGIIDLLVLNGSSTPPDGALINLTITNIVTGHGASISASAMTTVAPTTTTSSSTTSSTTTTTTISTTPTTTSTTPTTTSTTPTTTSTTPTTTQATTTTAQSTTTTSIPSCGDGVVQTPAEQCDLGALLNGSLGQCCTASCQFAASTVVCGDDPGECRTQGFCSGDAPTCSQSAQKPDGDACTDASCSPSAGTCATGVCKGTCAGEAQAAGGVGKASVVCMLDNVDGDG